MLSDPTKERLKANWGDKADALACFAEARLYDALSSWECYILALNPYDEDRAKVIIVDENKTVHVVEDSLTDLMGKWNVEGEIVELDWNFVRRQGYALFKALNERNPS